MGRAVESIDWAVVLATLLEGRTLQVSAEIRLGEKTSDGRHTLSVKVDESGTK